jgi:excisionase family DNA binding protein
MSHKLLSTAQVAEILGVTRETVADYAFNGVIPAARIARRWRFEIEDVSTFIRRSQGR